MAAAPTNVHELLEWNMIRAHDTFKSGYENILSRLDDPPMHDLSNFMGYCEAWAKSIDHHHDSEEKIVFPFLAQKLDFSQELEQHQIIHTALDEFLTHIGKVKADPSAFEAAKIKNMMQLLREPLYQHLDGEVEQISPERLQVFGADVLHELLAKLEAHAKSTGDPFFIVPYMRSHTAPEYKDVFPQMPWFLRKVVIPYVLALRYRGYWKYSPYAMS